MQCCWQAHCLAICRFEPVRSVVGARWRSTQSSLEQGRTVDAIIECKIATAVEGFGTGPVWPTALVTFSKPSDMNSAGGFQAVGAAAGFVFDTILEAVIAIGKFRENAIPLQARSSACA